MLAAGRRSGRDRPRRWFSRRQQPARVHPSPTFGRRHRWLHL